MRSHLRGYTKQFVSWKNIIVLCMGLLAGSSVLAEQSITTDDTAAQATTSAPADAGGTTVTPAPEESPAAPVVAQPNPETAGNAQPASPTRPFVVPVAKINAGDTAWMISASTLVLLMTIPGLALFYAGMVRKKNILGTAAQSFVICALVTVLWVVVGYSWSFMPGSEWLGDFSSFALNTIRYDKVAGTVSVHHLATSIPESVFCLFQLSFAIITPALITGAFAERMRFSALLMFMAGWSLLVYAPVAHWVWEPSGWLASRGILDFAGGTVVHINAGIAGLVAAAMLGPRMGFRREAMIPSNLGYTMIGASLLWVGWMGFNGGSAGAADGRAGMAVLVTQISTGMAVLSWMAAEWIVRGRPTLLGICSGAVAGLVAITPASGFVDPRAAVLIGFVAGVGCYWGATGLKRLLGCDDSLDVFGVHGVGGIIGALLTGVLADPAIGGVEGSVVTQLIGVVATLLWSGIVSALLLWILDMVVGLRVTESEEQLGLDLTQHGEHVE